MHRHSTTYPVSRIMTQEKTRNTAPLTVGDYTLAEQIGSGTSGVVFRATRIGYPDVAIKVIPSGRVSYAVRREVSVHFKLDHPNIVGLHEVLAVSAPGAKAPPLALVMELCKNDLFSELASARILSPSTVRSRMMDVARAVQYMQSQKLVHGDLKLENIAIGYDGVAKLLDFGCAREVQSSTQSFGGTLQYLAPEMVATASNPAGSPPSFETDMWALGVILYTCVAGAYPFNAHGRHGASEVELDAVTRNNILYDNYAPFRSSVRVPTDLRWAIHGLLQKDPKRRLSIDQLISILEGGKPSVASEVDLKHVSTRNTSSTRKSMPKKQTFDEAIAVVEGIRSQKGVRLLDVTRMYSPNSDGRQRPQAVTTKAH